VKITKVSNITEALQIILGMYTGVDGAICFLKLRAILENLEKQAQSGNRDAIEIVDMVKSFANLIRYAENS
jgi:hypothetical protein